MAVTFSGLTLVSSGIKSIGAVFPFQNNSSFVKNLNFHPLSISKRKPNFKIKCSSYKLSAGRNYQLSYDDDSNADPYLLKQMKEAILTVRSLLRFLAEQPSQLKYIEWPSFQSTLKTATLTLVLVAFLIVALSSVDSALSFILALILRRKA